MCGVSGFPFPGLVWLYAVEFVPVVTSKCFVEHLVHVFHDVLLDGGVGSSLWMWVVAEVVGCSVSCIYGNRGGSQVVVVEWDG